MIGRIGVTGMKRSLLAPALLASTLGLSGCISFAADPPPSLLTLTPRTSLPAGSAVTSTRDTAIAIYEPSVPQRINVTRVPVQVDDSSIAYLKDAVWVEKPARLFKMLLSETISAQTGRVTVDGEDPAILADAKLRGSLRHFGYDAPTSSVVVQFDAVRESEEGVIESRRFEATVPGVPAEAAAVGDALNRAANDVAAEVAEWVGS